MEHVPVLLEQTVNGLNIKPGGIYLDGTLGRGGHTAAIASKLISGRVFGLDRDAAALREAEANLQAYRDTVTLIHGCFGDVAKIAEENKTGLFDGMLFDFGVSSPQLDDSRRGFSYTSDAPLDMRMDQNAGTTAFEVVNTFSESEIARILFEYGEERYGRRIAAAIVRHREAAPIQTTAELAELVRNAMPGKALREKQHPAKRTFQAIRIAVNDELGEIERMLEAAPELLKPGGRICAISFHSLEDRLVKTAFKKQIDGCICPKDAPVCICGFIPKMKTITKKPIFPTEEEIGENPRSRSAKLRIAERL